MDILYIYIYIISMISWMCPPRNLAPPQAIAARAGAKETAAS